MNLLVPLKLLLVSVPLKLSYVLDTASFDFEVSARVGEIDVFRLKY